jgi:hypothetical protein
METLPCHLLWLRDSDLILGQAIHGSRTIRLLLRPSTAEVNPCLRTRLWDAQVDDAQLDAIEQTHDSDHLTLTSDPLSFTTHCVKTGSDGQQHALKFFGQWEEGASVSIGTLLVSNP